MEKQTQASSTPARFFFGLLPAVIKNSLEAHSQCVQRGAALRQSTGPSNNPTGHYSFEFRYVPLYQSGRLVFRWGLSSSPPLVVYIADHTSISADLSILRSHFVGLPQLSAKVTLLRSRSAVCLRGRSWHRGFAFLSPPLPWTWTFGRRQLFFPMTVLQHDTLSYKVNISHAFWTDNVSKN